MFPSIGRADSGSKIVGSMKAESVESGEKTSNTLRLEKQCPSFSFLQCCCMFWL